MLRQRRRNDKYKQTTTSNVATIDITTTTAGPSRSKLLSQIPCLSHSLPSLGGGRSMAESIYFGDMKQAALTMGNTDQEDEVEGKEEERGEKKRRGKTYPNKHHSQSCARPLPPPPAQENEDL